MLKFQDRIYGAIELPALAKEVAETCPVMLRLREVRMANIPFLTYPSFANVDRYEHSLGVAHLAWRWATRNALPQELGVALCIAALYHDGATPAFGHLFEEFLGRYGFDHETALVNLLMGQPENLLGGESCQVFLGLHCKLRDILPRVSDPTSPLTTTFIANLAAGKGTLGRLIKGDIDFDNIDNVIRASSAMGIVKHDDVVHPYEITDAIVFEDGEIRLDRSHLFALSHWAELRRQLYGEILNNPHEFRAQTSIKWAIEECAKEDLSLAEPGAWVLTDPMLSFEHLRKPAFSRLLLDKVRIGKPPELLFSAWLEDLSPLLGVSSESTIKLMCQQISDLINMDVYVNYYLDKRQRPIRFDLSNHSLSLFGSNGANSESTLSPSPAGKPQPSGVLGVIGVNRVEKYATQASNAIEEQKLAKRAFREESLVGILESVLCQPIRNFSPGWIGTSCTDVRQESLFALA
jgi:hypothetical protein